MTEPTWASKMSSYGELVFHHAQILEMVTILHDFDGHLGQNKLDRYEDVVRVVALPSLPLASTISFPDCQQYIYFH
ncbi:MAG: hypothetical protein IPG51_05780 [Chloroflexi bacterium]|nr:hypothetical protein [Chloroflexota bacterium]